MRALTSAATTGLAWKATPRPAAFSIGRSLAPSPTASASPTCRPRSRQNQTSGASLASFPKDGSPTPPGQRLADMQAALEAKPIERGELGLLAEDRQLDRAGQGPAVVPEDVGRLEVEAQRLPDQGGETGEATGDQGAEGAVLLHGRDQSR